jgi:TatD DNase family protein
MCTPAFEKNLRNELGANAQLPEIFGAQGVHPHDANQITDEIMAEFLRVIRNNKRIVALGETGLDYFFMRQSRESQIEAFRKHLDLARETGLPISLHCRDAKGERDARMDVLNILRDFPTVRCVMHCFSQDQEYADEVLRMPAGHILSFSGTVTYKGSDEIRCVAACVPSDRFVIETDCPYLAPQAIRGKRNEPAYIVETASFLANLREESFEKLAEATTDNAERFFGI